MSEELLKFLAPHEMKKPSVEFVIMNHYIIKGGPKVVTQTFGLIVASLSTL